jgi:hypothetical protein
MSRRVATAAAVTPEQPQAAKRMRTTSQNDADAVVLAERRKLAHEAARWAVDNGKGSKAAVLSGLFGTKETVTYNMIEPLMRELKSNNGKFLDDRDHHRQLLTNQERMKLAEWILRCGDGQNPKDRVKVSAKVRELREGKRLTAMHGSVTMQAVGDEAELREREAQEQAEAVLARKQQAADRKEAGVHAARERDEKFALCEVTCVCGVVPCLWVGWKRCLVCGPKKGLCKVRVCAAARRPLMLGYTPPAEQPE